MDDKRVAVHVSKGLYDLVKRRVEESGGEFKSVEDYVEFVLEEVVKEEEEDEEQEYTREDEEQIKRRLRSLGYL